MKEGFKRSKTGDRETNEEILQSHSHLPPPESGPSQNVFFPVSFCVPGFFFFNRRNVLSFAKPVSFTRPLVDQQWASHSLKSFIPWPFSPSITLHILN